MVDTTLPSIQTDRRPLRVLFLDLNSYFASVEQQEDPNLRGKPIIVAPVDADSTVAIAASYEAKRFGIKTGTRVGDAKRMCPDLIIVGGDHSKYVVYHKRIIEVAEMVLPVDKVCSIDEMRFRLIGTEQQPGEARELAITMKKTIREHVGECMTCSVGVAPNSFLAKLATEMQKPDGLIILTADEIESRTASLKLTDFTGINKKMQARLNAAGIFNPTQLYKCDRQQLRAAFGSIVGEKWWYLLRGYEMERDDDPQKSLGNSHVLPPEFRTEKGCREIILRLLQKASARLRSEGLVAGTMDVCVSGFEKSWKSHITLDATADTVILNREFLRVWETRDFEKPRAVGITFQNLRKSGAVTPSLFSEEMDRTEFNDAIDKMNRRFGKNSIFLASIDKAKNRASEKIAFQKTELFSEGAGDHEWPNTFKGVKPDPPVPDAPSEDPDWLEG
ncbi:MAG: DNA polymerase [Fimbriimonadaceae bacterium]